MGKQWQTLFGGGWGSKITADDDCCRGPAPVDPGNSKQGRSQHLGKDYLIRNIKRLGKNSVVGKLVEKRG